MTGAYPVLHVGSFGSARPSGSPGPATSPGPARSAGPAGSAGRVRPTRPWTRTFRGTPASVPEARRFVAGLLAGCPAREVLMICVSELSTNAIEHSDSGNGGVFIVEVDLRRPGVARIAVTDEGGPSLPAAASLALPAERSLMAEGGRGLAMVAACTSRWGYADAHPGRTVWAEATWPVAVRSPDEDTPRLPRLAASPDAPRNPFRRPRPAPGPDVLPRPPRRPRLRFSPAPPPDQPSGPAA